MFEPPKLKMDGLVTLKSFMEKVGGLIVTPKAEKDTVWSYDKRRKKLFKKRSKGLIGKKSIQKSNRRITGGIRKAVEQCIGNLLPYKNIRINAFLKRLCKSEKHLHKHHLTI